MAFVVVGLNHRTAPIGIRERFAFDPGRVPDALDRLLEDGEVLEACLLSTCNRTEIYLHSAEPDGGIERARRVLSDQAGDLPKPVEEYLYVRRDRETIEHLYRVISGLDSMVLGEVEIQGQVRDAYELARSLESERQVVGTVFNRLFQTALSVGSQVRTETRLSEGAASVPSAAVDLARKIFGTLEGRRGLVFGAGDMGELTVRCLVSEGMEHVVVVNRDFLRAQELAREFGGSAVPFEEFWDRVPEMDVLITSTAAPHPVITVDEFQRMMPGTGRTPLFIVDIAIPRDVEPAIGEQPNVFLYSIDDLQHIVTANFERRKEEIPPAQRIIDEAVEDFWRWYSGLRAVPLIREMRERAEQLRQAELERSMSQFDHLADEDRKKVERLTRALLQKLLHQPTARLRQAAENGRDQSVLEAARFLLGVDDEEDGEQSEG